MGYPGSCSTVVMLDGKKTTSDDITHANVGFVGSGAEQYVEARSYTAYPAIIDGDGEWSFDGVVAPGLSGGSSYSRSDVKGETEASGHMTGTATFTTKGLNVSCTSSGSGTLDAGTTIAHYGQSYTYVCTPESGYYTRMLKTSFGSSETTREYEYLTDSKTAVWGPSYLTGSAQGTSLSLEAEFKKLVDTSEKDVTVNLTGMPGECTYVRKLIEEGCDDAIVEIKWMPEMGTMIKSSPISGIISLTGTDYWNEQHYSASMDITDSTPKVIDEEHGCFATVTCDWDPSRKSYEEYGPLKIYIQLSAGNFYLTSVTLNLDMNSETNGAEVGFIPAGIVGEWKYFYGYYDDDLEEYAYRFRLNGENEQTVQGQNYTFTGFSTIPRDTYLESLSGELNSDMHHRNSDSQEHYTKICGRWCSNLLMYDPHNGNKLIYKPTT